MNIKRITLRITIITITFAAGLSAFWLSSQNLFVEKPEDNKPLHIFIATHENDSGFIFRAVIEKLSATGESAVIGENTFSEKLTDVGPIQAREPNLSKQALDDYQRKSDSPIALIRFFEKDSEYRFISEEAEKQIFMNSDGWKKFHAQYPGAKMVFHFSRVGFNIEHTEALVAVRAYRQPAASPSETSIYAYLVKVEGKWTVLKMFDPDNK